MASGTRPIGIDLGTTFSAVACVDEAGRTKMLPNAEGDLLTPSLVLFTDDAVLVGKQARRAAELHPDRLALFAKRDMGQSAYSREIGGRKLPPEVISAYILGKLKGDAEGELGCGVSAVITVPAYFDETRRQATAAAGEMADLDVLDIVNEPTAAALAYGEELGYLHADGQVDEPMKVLVFDLGGGTFDVTVVELTPRTVRTLATDGDVHLGGYDWDLRLVDRVAEQFAEQFGIDPREELGTNDRLWAEVEEAKRTLSARPHVSVRFEHAGHALTLRITRDEFEKRTADLVERTRFTCRQVIDAAGLTWNDIDRVLLAGGSTRMPMVSAMLSDLTGRQPDRSLNPDETVARGAALFAQSLVARRQARDGQSTLRVTNVNAHSLGIQGVDPQTGHKRNAILIPRNTPLPYKRTRKFITNRAGQRSIGVNVLEGESRAPEECVAIGKSAINDLPPNLPQGWPVHVTYEYGANGRLSISAVVRDTDKRLQLELERDAKLNRQTVDAWKQAVHSEAGLNDFDALIDAVLADEAPAQLPDSQPRAAKRTPSAAAPATPNRRAPTPSAPAEPTKQRPRPPKSNSAESPKQAATKPSPQKPLAAEPPAARVKPARPQQDEASSQPQPTVPLPAAAPPEAVVERGEADDAPPLVATREFRGAERATPPEELEDVLPPIAAEGPLLPAGHTDESDAALFDRPQHEVSAAPRRARGSSLTLIGHIIAPLVGIALGYYLLCYIQPRANVLNLSLPGLQPPLASDKDPASQAPADQPDTPDPVEPTDAEGEAAPGAEDPM